MRRRVVSGIVVSALVFLIIFTRREIFDAACALLAALAVFEVFEAFRAKGFRPVYFAGYTACVSLLLGSVEYWDRRIWQWLLGIILFVDIRLLMYLSLLLLFIFLIFRRDKYTVSDLSVTILGAFYICFLFWYMIMTRNLYKGEYAVMFIVLGAVATDTGAFFIGTYLGKHKLIPDVSANKT
ncbi:MAG: phosphatidate cytidylyltransferase, partial [Oscillospiraceae bacterium]|nr:phosphatidate cytidylyltransferase [Oscillospiraceae bacterium]